MSAPQTPSQTVGPFFHMRLEAEGGDVLVPDDHPDRIIVTGRVLDADRDHVEDALVELWQADAAGRYRHPHDDRDDGRLTDDFTGFGRACGDFETGEYRFQTVKPGTVPHPEGGAQAPHLNLIVQARGMLNPSFTRLYFADEAEANAADPVLRSVPEHRRSTLVAERSEDGPPTYRFDIRFGGDDETVFFDF